MGQLTLISALIQLSLGFHPKSLAHHCRTELEIQVTWIVMCSSLNKSALAFTQADICRTGSDTAYG